MTEISISLHKKRIALLTFGAIGFIALSFWLMQVADTQTEYSPLFLKFISIIGILFFTLCGIYGFRKLFDTKPALIINDQGIFDNSSAISAGLVEWKNITNVIITEVYDQKFITIETNNADELLSKQHGFKKILLSLNKNYYKSPIQIAASSLQCDIQELCNILKEQIAIQHKS